VIIDLEQGEKVLVSLSESFWRSCAAECLALSGSARAVAASVRRIAWTCVMRGDLGNDIWPVPGDVGPWQASRCAGTLDM